MKKAYITCVNTKDYVIGCLALNRTIKQKCKIPLYVMCTKEIYDNFKTVFSEENIIPIICDNIVLPEEVKGKFISNNMLYWTNTIFKLNIFKLTDFDKLVFVDSDMIVLEDLDKLFDCDNLTGVDDGDVVNINERKGINSGLMVITPNNDIFDKLMNEFKLIVNQNRIFGDQDIIQNYAFDWVSKDELHLDSTYNSCAYLLDSYSLKNYKIIHFFGNKKPWKWGKFYAFIRLMYYIVCNRKETFKYMKLYLNIIKKIRKDYNLYE